ncbi:MAG: hypothetical protein DMD33_14125 [Gemmatimonadetes bacterium]|nr:MAG: hypothetical protein DMD33_14125 [Gemmatimonadota bacterium]
MSGKKVTVAEAVALVDALCEKLKPADPNAGRTVTGMYLSPDGKVVKAIRIGPKPRREFADTVPHWQTDHAAGQDRGRAAADELARLREEAKALQQILDDPAVGAVERTRAEVRLAQVRREIDAFEPSLNPKPQAGKAPTAGA